MAVPTSLLVRVAVPECSPRVSFTEDTNIEGTTKHHRTQITHLGTRTAHKTGERATTDVTPEEARGCDREACRLSRAPPAETAPRTAHATAGISEFDSGASNAVLSASLEI
jgi:hypothetical protein